MDIIVKGSIDGKKIQAIKALREITGMGLRESKQMVDDADSGMHTRVSVFKSPVDVDCIEYLLFETCALTPNNALASTLEAFEEALPGMTVADLARVLRTSDKVLG